MLRRGLLIVVSALLMAATGTAVVALMRQISLATAAAVAARPADPMRGVRTIVVFDVSRSVPRDYFEAFKSKLQRLLEVVDEGEVFVIPVTADSASAPIRRFSVTRCRRTLPGPAGLQKLQACEVRAREENRSLVDYVASLEQTADSTDLLGAMVRATIEAHDELGDLRQVRIIVFSDFNDAGISHVSGVRETTAAPIELEMFYAPSERLYRKVTMNPSTPKTATESSTDEFKATREKWMAKVTTIGLGESRVRWHFMAADGAPDASF